MKTLPPRSRSRSAPVLAALPILLSASCSSGDGALEPQPRAELNPGGAVRDDSVVCPEGFIGCDGECIDPQSDPHHCGDCEQTCLPGEVCARSECADHCPSSLTDCDGACVDLQQHLHHCGECGQRCETPFTCERGACQCAAGTDQCGQVCAELERDVNHCGGCEQACDPGQSCTDGTCEGEGGCTDECPFPGGITWGCDTRFMYGANYAWHHFAGDFGGIEAFGQAGVAHSPEVEADLAEMSSLGIGTVRWWVFPEFRGEGVIIDADGVPVGLGSTVLADLERALELADEHDLLLMLCWFSFDNFSGSEPDAAVVQHSLRPILVDPAKRSALLETVVRPVARAAEASPHRDHLIAWDLMNEPEGAMTGANLYGNGRFPAWRGLDHVTHEEMETFFVETIQVLREESTALITLGSQDMAYRQAWTALDLDFYQFHNYGSWSFERSPSDYGITDKPVIVGEFPWEGLAVDRDDPSAGVLSYTDIVTMLYANGYAGSLAWQFTDSMRGDDDETSSFADAHACETRY